MIDVIVDHDRVKLALCIELVPRSLQSALNDLIGFGASTRQPLNQCLP